MSDPVKLRGHHFICLQFYKGEGYSPAFVENLRAVVAKAAENPAVVTPGADDVCAACPALASDGTCLDPHAGEVEVRRIDRLAWSVLGAQPGDALSLAEARARLADPRSIERWRESGCAGCVWADVCEPGWTELAGG